MRSLGSLPDTFLAEIADQPDAIRRAAADLVGAGAAVLVVSPDGAEPKGAHTAATGYLERSLVSAVSIVPVQILRWKLAADRGRTPGAYMRASKVTKRE